MDVVVVGGDSPKMRKRRPREWTTKKEKAFLSALAETCNVTLAAQAAAISASSAYRRRKSHAAFRAGWAEALGAAYQRLEMVLREIEWQDGALHLERMARGQHRGLTASDKRRTSRRRPARLDHRADERSNGRCRSAGCNSGRSGHPSRARTYLRLSRYCAGGLNRLGVTRKPQVRMKSPLCSETRLGML